MISMWWAARTCQPEVGVGIVVKSGSLGGIMDSTLSRNARDVGIIPTLGTIFPIFITPMTLVQ